MITNKDLIDSRFVKKEMDFWNVPGLAMAVMKDGKILLSEGYGYKNLETKDPITTKTQFGIASCSKAFTAALIALLVDEGLMEFDTPIHEYLPDFRMYDPVATEQCTIRDMLNHRTGLPAHDALWVDDIDRAELFRRLRYIKPNKPFRSATQYNNTIYTIIGHIAEKVAGESWDDLVKTRIFNPIGMENSNTSVDDMVKYPDYATPYLDRDGQVEEMKIWNVDLGAPAVAVNTCAEDMIKWVEFQINKGAVNGKQIISEENVTEMHSMQTTFKLWPWDFGVAPLMGGYGMGWFTDSYRGYNWIFHTGEIEGYCSIQAFIPDKKLGVVMLMNLHKPCIPLIVTLLYTIFDEVLGLEPINWPEKIRPEKGHFGYLYYPWDCNLMENSVPVERTVMSHAPEEYVGHFFNPGYGDFKIQYEDGEFTGIYRGVVQKIEHFHYDIMKVPDVKQDTIFVTAPLRFITDPYTGKIDSFDIQLEPLVDPIIFKRVK